MGLVFVDAEVQGGPRRRRPVRFLIDSGATYSVLPRRVWRAIGLKPKRTMVFTLADGTELRRKVSECLVRLEGQEGHTPVVLGARARTKPCWAWSLSKPWGSFSTPSTARCVR